ncbi:molybdopterin molybdotransferase MoeA [Fuscibacter oryzae]|uniref:Molybdopterin molybdenumtransferase n=1 Tax=Fuscibacter oryzae TaxID=2803939 RepID=A0A8J7MSA4_9RHOB|nr:molybdopterin molybdotransferase MoeA [Fuscibacter oryzae]MBL4928601.1 molybdopterin molybdotransferase MoeA [Fuscibacter oryzae]
MITVDQALARCFALCHPVGTEEVPLRRAAGRVQREPATARLTQPPFDASAMDGYALGAIGAPGASYEVVGEAGAGHAFAGHLTPSQAIRIFTGAPLPEGAVSIAIQEEVQADGPRITLKKGAKPGDNIRPRGQDFAEGASLPVPRRLTANDIALLAAMNIPQVTVARKPVVALIATGDELVMPGENPGPDQIICSNTFALAAMVEAAGGEARMLPIARDTEDSLRTVLGLAEGADVIVTIGGASVGDHDLVGKVAADMGMERAFWKIAMRPGKPLMAGRLGGAVLLGLPGNPVSAIVCGHLFLLPMLAALQGLPALPPATRKARLGTEVGPTGPRAHYMRARLSNEGAVITPFDRQDSALLSILSGADALLIRPMDDGPRQAGELAEYIPI